MDKKSFPKEKLDRNFTELLLNNVHDGIYIVDQDCKIFFWNKGAEQITGFDESTVNGKKCSDNILSPVDDSGKNLCEEDCPVKQALSDGKTHSIEAYLQHKEGHRLPVSIRAFPILGEDGEIVAAVETFNDISPKFIMPQRKLELERMQLLDPLTEVGNQRFLEIHLQSRLEEIKKYRIPFALLYIDVDNLKEVNDSYGKPVGDQVLRSIAQTITNNIRFFDIVGRWESDEFLVVLLNIDESKLDYVGNKIRLLIENSNITVGSKMVRATVSVGATVALRVDSLDILITRARSFMDHSKWLGRNKVSMKASKEGEEL
jgi:diguanylate cyclase (GGDEF)-like protein/PAS domain S-box-containing protein